MNSTTGSHTLTGVIFFSFIGETQLAGGNNIIEFHIDQLSIQLNSTKLRVIMIIGVFHPPPTHQELSRHFQMT